MTPIASSERTSLADRVTRALRDQIVNLSLEPFSPISEKKISEALGVSRTPVREALARLAAHHLVDIYPQRGTFVAPMRIPELERSQFLREAIELALVQRVAELADRADLVVKLRAEVELQFTFAKIGDERRFFSSDEDFHRLIAAYAGLPRLWEEILHSKVHMDRFRRLTLLSLEKDVGIIAAQHHAIIDAIEAGDPEAAAGAMRAHLRRILDFVDQVMAVHPAYFEGQGNEPAMDGAASGEKRQREASKHPTITRQKG